MISIQQLVTTASQNPKVVHSVLTANVSTVLATALEWVPLVIGVVASVIGLVASTTLLYNGNRQHKLKMEILEFDLKERKSRNGKRTRRDDSD